MTVNLAGPIASNRRETPEGKAKTAKPSDPVPEPYWIDQDGDTFPASYFDRETAHRHQLVLVGDPA